MTAEDIIKLHGNEKMKEIFDTVIARASERFWDKFSDTCLEMEVAELSEYLNIHPSLAEELYEKIIELYD